MNKFLFVLVLVAIALIGACVGVSCKGVFQFDGDWDIQRQVQEYNND